ncbi:MAG: hypothetical protein F6K19_45240 [Cyanothece sp. SIO1E1]|nr:hypothetical protein [Cyanothece sp. SIO1E1]
MSNIAKRYTDLCDSYIQLADSFQKLDVEHMSLKSKIVPLLQGLKAYRQVVEKLKQEKAELEQELQTLTARYEQLESLEVLLQPEAQAALIEAEKQVDLVRETIQEMESDSTPDLDETEKTLLKEYYNSPDEFERPKSEAA